MLSRECQEYVGKAAQYICKLTAHLSGEDIRHLLTVPEPREMERRVDAAALRGDVAATKAACRLGWEAWKVALATQEKGTDR